MSTTQAAYIITNLAIDSKYVGAGRYCALMGVLSQVRLCAHFSKCKYNYANVEMGRATKELAHMSICIGDVLPIYVDKYIADILSILGYYTRLYIGD